MTRPNSATSFLEFVEAGFLDIRGRPLRTRRFRGSDGVAAPLRPEINHSPDNT